jgi:hypothetical protein
MFAVDADEVDPVLSLLLPSDSPSALVPSAFGAGSIFTVVGLASVHAWVAIARVEKARTRALADRFDMLGVLATVVPVDRSWWCFQIPGLSPRFKEIGTNGSGVNTIAGLGTPRSDHLWKPASRVTWVG